MQAWAEEHEGDCEVEGGELALRAAPKAGPGERQLPRPSAPSLSAHRTGDSILIRHDLSAHGAEVSYILLTVTAKDRRDATRSKKFRLKAAHGTVRLPLPLADGPYLAAASTFTARNERSDTKVVDVLP